MNIRVPTSKRDRPASPELAQWQRFQRVITRESLILDEPRGPIIARFARFRADTSTHMDW